MHNKTVKTINITEMHTLVKNSYDSNDYNDVYRKKNSISEFEIGCLQLFLQNMRHLQPQVLDIGCGSGYPYDLFLVENKCCITGIDISQKQIKSAKQNIKSGQYICKDILEFQFPQEKFDGIIMLYSLFHIHRKYHQNLMKQIYFSMKKNGRLLINVRKDTCDLKFKEDFCGKPMLWNNYSIEEFINITARIGFCSTVIGDEKNHGSNESHIWLLLTK